MIYVAYNKEELDDKKKACILSVLRFMLHLQIFETYASYMYILTVCLGEKNVACKIKKSKISNEVK